MNSNPEPRLKDATRQNQVSPDMLFLMTTFFMRYTMPEFCFFRKGKHIAFLKKTDSEKSARLAVDGWEKQPEEVRAANTESALARLAERICGRRMSRRIALS